MKKLMFPFLLLLLISYSCTDDIVRHEPSIRGDTPQGYFYSNQVSAHLEGDSTLFIIGKKGSQTITLQLHSMEVGIPYHFGENTGNTATFTGVNGITYSTDSTGSGQLIIEEGGNSLTGTFYFYAQGLTDSTSFSFSQGGFIDIPFGDGVVNDTIPTDSISQACQIATMTAETAATNYEELLNSGTPQEIHDACVAYQDALTAQIQACGDASGEIQAVLDSLDCAQ